MKYWTLCAGNYLVLKWVETARKTSKMKLTSMGDELLKEWRKMVLRNLTTLQCFDHISRSRAPIDMNEEVMETRQNFLQLSCFAFLLILPFSSPKRGNKDEGRPRTRLRLPLGRLSILGHFQVQIKDGRRHVKHPEGHPYVQPVNSHQFHQTPDLVTSSPRFHRSMIDWSLDFISFMISSLFMNYSMNSIVFIQFVCFLIIMED